MVPVGAYKDRQERREGKKTEEGRRIDKDIEINKE